jgi:hypothetical protein
MDPRNQEYDSSSMSSDFNRYHFIFLFQIHLNHVFLFHFIESIVLNYQILMFFLFPSLVFYVFIFNFKNFSNYFSLFIHLIAQSTYFNIFFHFCFKFVKILLFFIIYREQDLVKSNGHSQLSFETLDYYKRYHHPLLKK